MTKARDPKERELERIARLHRAVASQAEVLSELEKDVPNYLDSAPTLALLAADTVIFEWGRC